MCCFLWVIRASVLQVYVCVCGSDYRHFELIMVFLFSKFWENSSKWKNTMIMKSFHAKFQSEIIKVNFSVFFLLFINCRLWSRKRFVFIANIFWVSSVRHYVGNFSTQNWLVICLAAWGKNANFPGNFFCSFRVSWNYFLFAFFCSDIWSQLLAFPNNIIRVTMHGKNESCPVDKPEFFLNHPTK